MKFVCLGYIAQSALDAMSESESQAMLDQCFGYDDILRANGHFSDGQALQPATTAKTLRWRGSSVAVTDGPYTETKEFLGGILVLEAENLEHAVQLMSKHPGVKYGPFEIRPAADLTEMVHESEMRRAKNRIEQQTVA